MSELSPLGDSLRAHEFARRSPSPFDASLTGHDYVPKVSVVVRAVDALLDELIDCWSPLSPTPLPDHTKAIKLTRWLLNLREAVNRGRPTLPADRRVDFTAAARAALETAIDAAQRIEHIAAGRQSRATGAGALAALRDAANALRPFIEKPPPAPADLGEVPLPELNANLFAIHYSQEMQENSPTQTPPVSAIVLQHVLTGRQHAFAAFQIAEQRQIAACELAARQRDLETQTLTEFFGFVAQHAQAVWLHWAMRLPRFGFEVLAQRGRCLGLNPVAIPPERRFDLSSYLKRRYGENYVPHPRLWYAMKANDKLGPEVLDEAAAAAAWANHEYQRLLDSLACKVDAIADMYDLVRCGMFKIPQTLPAGEADGRSPAPADPPTFTIVRLRELTGLENDALNKYAKAARVPTAARGKRNHALNAEQTTLLLKKIVATCTTSQTRDKCIEALEMLEEIRKKPTNPQEIG